MDKYRTKDLGLASFLVLMGYPIEEMEWPSGRDCYFSFTQSEDLLDYIAAYSTNEAVADPKEFLDTYVQTKQQMFGLRPDLAKR